MSVLQSEVDVKKTKKGNEAEDKQLQWPWSSLPDDLLSLILGRLNWVDRVRFSLASKNFPSLLHRIPCRPSDRVPWLFTIYFGETSNGGSYGRCRLMEPFSGRTYNVRIMDQEARKYLIEAIPFSSSHGWVLLLRRKSRVDHKPHYFSLYRPYSNKLVKLPKLEVCHDFEVGRATISVDQTPLISVFYICLDSTHRTVNISMCHIGATHWKELKFQLPRDGTEVKELESALYADGFVYCVFDHGSKIVIFDVVLQDWNFYSYYFRPLGPLNKHYVIFNGDLLQLHIYQYMDGTLSYSWRFDKFLKQWVQQETLGDLTLFLAYSSIFPVKAVGELSSYANAVTIPANYGNCYRSFKIGKHECCELYLPENYQFYSRHHCWIEPPLLTQN